MNLLMKQKQSQRHREQTGDYQVVGSLGLADQTIVYKIDKQQSPL